MYKRFSRCLLASMMLALHLPLFSCGGDSNSPTPEPTPSGVVTVTLPATLDVVKGETCTFTNVSGNVTTSDYVLFEASSGTLTQCQVTAVSSGSLSFMLPDSFQSGTYKVYLRTGDRRISLGSMDINIVSKKIELLPTTTVYGTVETDEGPVAGVVVSDGVEVVVTNENGEYQIPSKKSAGYVFISVPGGYEPQSSGVLPTIYSVLKAADNVAEAANFKLKKVNQDNYKVLFLGDMHLANRNGDLSQFRKVTDDINALRAANGSIPVYGITLGDMTWDIYWDDNKFKLSDYVKEMNNDVKDMIIYHTIGNHDNDYKALNNTDAKASYNALISPIYYSFNIGKVHYIVIDDIDCSDYDGTKSRNYTKNIFVPQMEWLKKDLAYVSKTTPVVIMSHAPVYTSRGLNEFTHNLKNGEQLVAALDGYKVHFVTGHTHKNYNVTPAAAITGGKQIYEHNVAAVCSDWWWSGHLTPGCLVSTDGTPSGYSVWTFSGDTPQNVYKAVGKDENYQFRSYDLNNVAFSMSDVPNLKDAKVKEAWRVYCDQYPGNRTNEILVNVWNYNPSWTVSIATADGKALEVKPVTAYDPLHIAAMSKVRFNNDVTSTPNFVTETQYHFFKATAPDADTDVVITVKDEFGHTWTETMERPKAFSTEIYSIK